jgi:uncharacterized FlaG/YvyC family protein
MNTIGKNTAIAPSGPGVQVQEPKTQLKPTVGQTTNVAAPPTVRDALIDAGVQAPAPQPQTGQQYLDPDKMQEFVAQVSEAIRQASTEPYLVGFKPDPDSKNYLIEIRTIDGTLVTSFAPEKVLNLNGNLDDLLGMVIDRKT